MIINAIVYLKNNNDMMLTSLNDFDLTTYDLNDKNTSFIKSYFIKNKLTNKEIIFSFKNNIKSIVLLNILNKLNLSKKVTILYISTNKDGHIIKFIKNLHIKYGFKYNIKTTNTTCNLSINYKHAQKYELRNIYTELCKELNTDIIIHTEDQNSICNDLLKYLFTNKLNLITDKNKYTNYTIYRPLFNLDIEIKTNSTDIDDNFVDLINTYKHHYPNWKNNLQHQLTLLTRNFNNNTVLQLDSGIEYYKNGFVINLNEISYIDDKYCTIELKYLFSKAFNYYNIMLYNTTMNKLLSIFENDTCIKHDNWIFVLDNKKIIGMDYKKCQDFINNCKYSDDNTFSWEMSETNNSIISFLNEDFFEYYFIGTNNENTYEYVFFENNFIDKNNENTYENVFYENNNISSKLLKEFTFNYKNKEKGSYYIINNK